MQVLSDIEGVKAQLQKCETSKTMLSLQQEELLQKIADKETWQLLELQALLDFRDGISQIRAVTSKRKAAMPEMLLPPEAKRHGFRDKERLPDAHGGVGLGEVIKSAQMDIRLGRGSASGSSANLTAVVKAGRERAAVLSSSLHEVMAQLVTARGSAAAHVERMRLLSDARACNHTAPPLDVAES